MRPGPTAFVPNILGHELRPATFLIPQSCVPLRSRATPRSPISRNSERTLPEPKASQYDRSLAIRESFLHVSSFMRENYAWKETRTSRRSPGRHCIHTDTRTRIRKINQGPIQRDAEGRMITSPGTQLAQNRERPMKTIPLYDDRLKLWRQCLSISYRKGDPEELREKYNIRQSYSWEWLKGFAALNSIFDPWPLEDPQTYTPTFSPNSGITADNLWKDDPDRKTLIERCNADFEAWRVVSNYNAYERVCEVILWLLHHNIDRALQYVDAITAANAHVPSHVIADALWYIAKVQRARQRRGQHVSSQFIPTFWQIWSQSKNLKHRINSNMVFLLDVLSDKEQAKTLYSHIWLDGVPMFPNMQLRLARDFARRQEIDRSLDAFERAFSGGIHSDVTLVQATCATILRQTIRIEDGYRILSEVASFLLKHGVKFNIIHYNALMLNAIESGDIKTAFETFNMLETNGMTPDAYTYAILLKGCKQSDDESLYTGLAAHCAEKAHKFREPIIAAEHIHYLYLYHKQAKTSNLFDILLPHFARSFRLEPLHKLGIIPRHVKTIRESTSPLDASLPAIYIMLAARLEELAGQVSVDLDDWLWSRYQAFRAAVLAGDPDLGPFAESAHVYNAFMKAWCAQPNLVKHAPQILKDMASPLPPDAVHSKLGRPLRPAEPTIHTWSILIHGFMKHGQPAAAEKVMDLMRDRGVKPVDATWYSLLKGYAQVQDVRNLKRTLREGERSGTLDKHTLSRAMASARSPQALLEALESDLGADDENTTPDIRSGHDSSTVDYPNHESKQSKPDEFEEGRQIF